MQSLREHPPVDFSYELLHVFQGESSVNLIYRFSKPEVSTPMSQVFTIREGRIAEILLIFDTSRFS